MKFQIRNVRKFVAKFAGIILRNWGGQSTWGLGSILIMKTEWKKLRKNSVENVDAGECLNYTGEKMPLAILAWGIGKAGQRRMRKKLGTWIGFTGFYIRRRRRRITRNIASWKLNVKCVCKVRKCNWARHLGSRKHMLGGGGGKVDGDVGGVGGWYEG